MKARLIALLAAIVVPAAIIAAIGSYIKYEILQPLELDDDYHVMELPFQVLTDEGLKFTIEYAMMLKQEQPGDTEPEYPTEPETTVPTTAPTTTPSETTKPTDPNTDTIPGTTVPISPETTVPTQPTTEPTTQPPTTETTPNNSNNNSYKYPEHDFSQGAVSSDWFDNVLFIGDSRTVGLRDYARSGNAEYFCSVGMSVFSIFDKSCEDIGRFSKQDLKSLLSSKTYDKIFINLGINECGYPATTLIAAYEKLVKTVREYQPDAVIILQGILTVTEKYAGSKSYFKPKHINSINEKIEAMADNSTIYYIDANLYFTDPNGYLYKDVTGDGCHFTGKYYKVWAEWISFAVGQLGI